VEHYKIIHLVKGRADPSASNGVNVVIHNLATIQQKQDFDVEVWGITKNTHLTKHEHIYPLHLFKPTIFPFSKNIKLTDRLTTIPRSTIFHIHSGFIPEFYTFTRSLKKYGFKWIISSHGVYALNKHIKNILLKSIYKKIFENNLINEASAIHALSTSEAQLFNAQVRKKTFIVPNGVVIKDKFKTIYSTDNFLRISYCGRIVMHHKGLDLLLKSINLFKKQKENIHLDLIGDGPDIKLLKNMAETLKINKQVTFHGNKMGQEKEDIVIKSDIFIHTSRWEGMPLAVLEAASLGLPLLVSQQTNLADYVYKSGAGFVVNELTHHNIHTKLLMILEEKINKKLDIKGRAARKMAINEFSWENCVELFYKNIYTKIT
tara:strand:+ start:649 stop:1773 length:1125 start_codon:yes stop_codon:yes gene_type:complete